MKYHNLYMLSEIEVDVIAKIPCVAAATLIPRRLSVESSVLNSSVTLT